MRAQTKISMKDASSKMILTVNVTRVKEYRVRLWIATQLMRIVAWLAWCKIELKVECE